MTGELIPAGTIRKAHGTGGAFLVVSDTIPAPEGDAVCPMFIDGPGGARRLDIVSARPVRDGLLIRCRDITRREDADALAGTTIRVPEEYLQPLDDWTFYTHQLIGMAVETVSGEPVGELVAVMQTGANDVYVVRNGAGKEQFIPAIRSVIRSVDPEQGRMRIDPLDGMLDGDGDAV
ncbi:MAG TPA: ribosome maturation factor RimM [bacterium]|nr:ribosome maturation factor RimM [bacterium]